ncbi:hypothetical protein AGR1C_Lc10055 [Agrobacterium fabacearum TT111]|nr:hypothetical protein AGR1C_Lc10055 [Agrobacterium fabacearum TT111]
MIQSKVYVNWALDQNGSLFSSHLVNCPKAQAFTYLPLLRGLVAGKSFAEASLVYSLKGWDFALPSISTSYHK